MNDFYRQKEAGQGILLAKSADCFRQGCLPLWARQGSSRWITSSADQKIPNQLVKITFLGEAQIALRVDIRSGLVL